MRSLRHSRIARFLFLPLLFIFLALHSEAAFCASLTVKIRQINPDGQAQQVTCAEKQKCVLSLALQTGPAQTKNVTVEILFVPGSVVMKFQTPDGYLYSKENNATDKDAVYEAIWHSAASNTPSQHLVSLFLPAVQNPFMARILNAAQEAASNKPHPTVAELEITTTAEAAR